MNVIRIKNLAAFWGVLGVILLLAFAIYRLAPRAYTLTDESLLWWQWAALFLWCIFMVYSEGYRAFGKAFSPRVVARAQHLSKKTTLLRGILAPVFCVGYFGAPKKRVITAYALITGLILIIVLVSFVPSPYRGIIDVGVVLGLLYGIATLLYWSIRALRSGGAFVTDPEVTSTN